MQMLHPCCVGKLDLFTEHYGTYYAAFESSLRRTLQRLSARDACYAKIHCASSQRMPSNGGADLPSLQDPHHFSPAWHTDGP